MASIDADGRTKPLVDKTFRRIAVRVFLGQILEFQHSVLPEEFPDRRRIVVRSGINKQDDFLQTIPLRIGGKIRQVLAELDVPSARKAIRDYVLSWPEQGDETIYALCVAESRNKNVFAFPGPAAFRRRQEINPLLVLESDRYLFLKRADATRLYRRISALFR